MTGLTRDELRRAAAAMAVVVEAGQVTELRERIAAAWQWERERKMRRTIGDRLPVAIELGRLLRIDRDCIDAAVCETMAPSRERIALDEIIHYGRELWLSRHRAVRKGGAA